MRRIRRLRLLEHMFSLNTERVCSVCRAASVINQKHGTCGPWKLITLSVLPIGHSEHQHAATVGSHRFDLMVP
jgi:hypothetical protein